VIDESLTPSANSINNKGFVSNSVRIYPNPASDIITLNFDRISNENVTLKIYNAIGSIVKKEMFVQNQQKIIIGDLCYGIYIVEIKSKELIEKQKLIIQR
jgi:hypothetical protein